ncbi:NAD-dependent epimerase/dehydratase family protein [Embleya sp. NPDC001921]
MRVLVLGGTAFVGRAVVVAALERGWTVTTFNRGVTDDDVPGVHVVRGDRYKASDLERLVTHGPWDAVIDTSGYIPRNVLDTALCLHPAAGRYVFMSTVSVYEEWPATALSEASPLLPCPPDAGPDYGVDVEDGPTKYGYQKAGCEAAAQQTFGAAHTVVLRPGVVLGPRETVGRLPWWLRRVAAGGVVVAPGKPDRGIQPVDVRDVGDFVVRCLDRSLTGAFNLTAPMDRDTFGDLLAACAHATASNATLRWVDDDLLLRAGVRQWSELPLWRTMDGVWRVDGSRAAAAGFACRPLAATVADTWEWLKASGAPLVNERSAEIGLSEVRERSLLAASGLRV